MRVRLDGVTHDARIGSHRVFDVDYGVSYANATACGRQWGSLTRRKAVLENDAPVDCLECLTWLAESK